MQLHGYTALIILQVSIQMYLRGKADPMLKVVGCHFCMPSVVLQVLLKPTVIQVYQLLFLAHRLLSDLPSRI